MKNKDLVKKEIGNISTRLPKEYEIFLNFDSEIEDNVRKKGIEDTFNNFVEPFSNKVLTRKGIEELAKRDEIYVLGAVKDELGLS